MTIGSCRWKILLIFQNKHVHVSKSSHSLGYSGEVHENELEWIENKHSRDFSLLKGVVDIPQWWPKYRPESLLYRKQIGLLFKRTSLFVYLTKWFRWRQDEEREERKKKSKRRKGELFIFPLALIHRTKWPVKKRNMPNTDYLSIAFEILPMHFAFENISMGFAIWQMVSCGKILCLYLISSFSVYDSIHFTREAHLFRRGKNFLSGSWISNWF